MTKWHDIWSRRDLGERSDPAGYSLADVLGIDGFDSDTGRIEESAWMRFTQRIRDDLAIAPGDSVYDVGCGAGAFLYPFARHWGCPVGGLDYAPAQVQVCRQLFKGDDFQADEALHMPVEPRYAYVASFSVFFYFPDLAYATSVLEKMLRKATKGVLVLDVPDAAREAECESYRASTLPPGEYERKYAGLQHLYYERSWFEDLAHRHGWRARTQDQCIDGYINNRFRFNCIVTPA